MKQCKSCGTTESKNQWYKGPRCASCYHSNHYKSTDKAFKLGAKYSCGKQHAKKRKVVFKLSFKNYEKIIENGCYYCEKDLKTQTGSSLDRLNPNKGYIKSNLVGCCGNCNMLKHNILTPQETKQVIYCLRTLRNTEGSPWDIKT